MNTNYCNLLAAASVDGLAVLQHGKLLTANSALVDMLGYTLEELTEMELAQFIVDIAPGHLDQVISKRERASFECQALRKDGSQMRLLLHSQFLELDGEEMHTLVFHDNTERWEVEKALIRSEREYKTLFEESRDAIYISSRKGRILNVNPAAGEMLGFSKEELLRLDTHDLYADPADRMKFQAEIEQHGSVKDYELTLRRKDGTLRDCILSSSVRLAHDRTVLGYQGIIRDITQLKRAQKLKREKELAERSAKMKEQFLANMSHEIRTPMNAVFGMTNLLLDSKLTEQQAHFLDVIRGSTDHLLVLINDILDYSKIEAGRMDFEERPFDVRKMIHELTGTLEYKAQSQGIELLAYTDDEVPKSLHGDQVRLKQILMNLLTNAIKFTEVGKVEIKTELIDKTPSLATVKFVVADTGTGIPEEQLRNIFDSFTQVSDGSDKLHGGTGLGLAITKKLVELQGGAIQVKSQVGVGSTFTCTLRYKYSEVEAEHQERKNARHIPTGNLEPLHILIAEDNRLNQIVITETLKRWGSITADLAANGEEAVELFGRSRYDLVIMDMQMPVLDGYNATRQIRSGFGDAGQQTPILAMTAFATTADADKCLEAGMNDYIAKPFEPAILLQKIVRLTRKKFTATEPVPVLEITAEPAKQEVAQEDESVEVDLSYLTSVTEGDPELHLEMLNTILAEIPEELANMKQLLADKKWNRLGATAHKFKSTATLFGGKNLARDLKTIEINARAEQNLDEIPELMARVERMSVQAEAQLNEQLESLNT